MLKILFEDKWIAVAIKPAGVLSEEFGRGRCMPEMLKKQTGAYKIGVVHRLDKPASGVMVFSKHPKAAAGLSKAVAARRIEKEYFCVVEGRPEPDKGDMKDYLWRDKAKNKSFVVKSLRKGAKEASLSYETAETVKAGGGELSLIRVKLHTGRTHQIRVQFASRGMPLLGDGKYGSKVQCDLALFSYRLAFSHPVSGTPIDISAAPENKFPWNKFLQFKNF